jgi:hypothetical protein
LSLEALQLKDRLVCVTLEAARPAGVDGGVESPGGDVAQAAVRKYTLERGERLPEASAASTA